MRTSSAAAGAPKIVASVIAAKAIRIHPPLSDHDNVTGAPSWYVRISSRHGRAESRSIQRRAAARGTALGERRKLHCGRFLLRQDQQTSSRDLVTDKVRGFGPTSSRWQRRSARIE